MEGQNEMPDPWSKTAALIGWRKPRFVGFSFPGRIITFEFKLDIVRLDAKILNDDPAGSFIAGIFRQEPF
jgi:hypothetical protein